ncbi:hypothetical protein GCM10011514_51480 [Emticicia aquatilis]|uniref:T9SS C-terminal target domain-containing protein n=1 Tax=Emticicia aquatilis TaxID=1537369 RepID=A0A916Z7W2_9BACT|nr:hypothetical protein [Emticicia aquatilis]GGD81101.1 hypothetical protein GCM10011514_51480 [Emticicia aquatilis]
MKAHIATLLLLFSAIFVNAQDLLLSEDFDYPIGDNLNNHNWKPLTSTSDNPIKIVSGLSKTGYSASGGAAYLNKNGQDVVRSFTPVTDEKIYLSFQVDVKKYFPVGNTHYPKQFSPLSYFMFLSSKENPTIPLLKFSLVSTNFAGINWYLVVRDSKNEILSLIPVGNNTADFSFSYQLTGTGSGQAYLRNESTNISAFSGDGFYPSKAKVTNISNVVLSQSDINDGTECTIDRIRVGKTWGSVMPCVPGLAYKDKFISSLSVWKYLENGGATTQNVNPNDFKKDEIILKTCANEEILSNSLTAYIHTKIGADVTDLSVVAPSGFKALTSYYNETNYTYTKTNNILKSFYHYYDTNNSLDILLVGNSDKISPNGNPIAGSAGVYEGEIHFTPVGGYCEKTVWKIKGIIEDCDNKADLLLKEDFDYTKGETLTQNNWEALTPSNTNPIKVVDGLVKKNYTASGGAAYLNRNGQDVKRALKAPANDQIFVSFQLNYKAMQRINSLGWNFRCDEYLTSFLNPSNYFMFLSSKEEPTRPLLKFSLVNTPVCFDYITFNSLVVRDKNDQIIAAISLGNEDLTKKQPSPVIDINFSYFLSGDKIGTSSLTTSYRDYYSGRVLNQSVSKVRIPNLSNIVLSQSNILVGSEVIVDRIRVGKTLKSITDGVSTVAQTQSDLDTEPTSLNATVFPNTTDGKIDLLINEKAPEGEFEIMMSDKMGNKLYQNSGTWESQKSAIEEILSKNASGQYFLSIKQNNNTKTIRVFRQ